LKVAEAFLAISIVNAQGQQPNVDPANSAKQLRLRHRPRNQMPPAKSRASAVRSNLMVGIALSFRADVLPSLIDHIGATLSFGPRQYSSTVQGGGK
jgi:hypothetical protein